MAVEQAGHYETWPVPTVETPVERRRRQRREYHARRTRAIGAGPEHARRWNVGDARVALDTALTVPQAAKKVGRSANSVESLRRRWRAGRLPAGLTAHMPDPPRPDTGVRAAPELPDSTGT